MNVISKIDHYYEKPMVVGANKTDYTDMLSPNSIDRRVQPDLIYVASKDKFNANLKKIGNDVLGNLNSNEQANEVFSYTV